MSADLENGKDKEEDGKDTQTGEGKQREDDEEEQAPKTVKEMAHAYWPAGFKVLELVLCLSGLAIHVYATQFLLAPIGAILYVLFYVACGAYILIVTQDLILICARRPIPAASWLAFAVTGSLFFLVCAAFVVIWTHDYYIKWVYFIITTLTSMCFTADAFSTSWTLKKSVVYPMASVIPHLHLLDPPSEPLRLSCRDLPSRTTRDYREELITYHNVSVQCDSIDALDIRSCHVVYSQQLLQQHQQLIPPPSAPLPAPPGLPELPPPTAQGKRKRTNCRNCNQNAGGRYRRPSSTSTYGGTFHMSKDVAPISSSMASLGTEAPNATSGPPPTMKSPWTNEQLYIWQSKL